MAEQEIQEHVHEAREPFDKRVAGTMAIIAALLAVVSVLGQHFNTEKLLAQGKASDQWAYAQAKDIRRYVAQTTRDTLKDLRPGSALISVYDQDTNTYKKQASDIQEKAREYENERDAFSVKAGRFHFGEVFLEVAIVLSSLAILTRQSGFYWAGIATALAGIVIAAGAYWARP